MCIYIYIYTYIHIYIYIISGKEQGLLTGWKQGDAHAQGGLNVTQLAVQRDMIVRGPGCPWLSSYCRVVVLCCILLVRQGPTSHRSAPYPVTPRSTLRNVMSCCARGHRSSCAAVWNHGRRCTLAPRLGPRRNITDHTCHMRGCLHDSLAYHIVCACAGDVKATPVECSAATTGANTTLVIAPFWITMGQPELNMVLPSRQDHQFR